MKICVYGAGAIGGHIAARLAQGGAEVSVVARGPHLAAMRDRGLTVHAPDGVLHSRPRASDDPAALGPQDAVFVTVKAPGLGAVAAGIAPLLKPETAVAFVMNGIPWWYLDRTPGEPRPLLALDPGDAIRRAVGVRRTIGGVVYSAATVTEPGIIHIEAPDSRFILGEILDAEDSAVTPRLRALGAALEAGGMGAPLVPDIRQAVWTKLLGNLMNGPLCLLARADIADTLADPAVRDLSLRVAREVLALAAAEGWPIAGDTADARLARSAKLHHRPSILQDLESGRTMEIEALFRAPLRLANERGVAMPNLAAVVALATRAAIAAGLYARPEEPGEEMRA